jgi:hypothetical protein
MENIGNNSTSSLNGNDFDWIDSIIDSNLDIDQMEEAEAEADLRIDEFLRNGHGLPRNLEIDWEILAQLSVEEAERLHDEERFLEEVKSREIFIAEIYSLGIAIEE